MLGFVSWFRARLFPRDPGRDGVGGFVGVAKGVGEILKHGDRLGIDIEVLVHEFVFILGIHGR